MVRRLRAQTTRPRESAQVTSRAARAETLTTEPPNTRMLRGTILLTDVASHTYHVALSDGSQVIAGRMRSGPGDSQLLEHGTQVVVTRDLGAPYIVGVLPTEARAQGVDTENTLTGTVGHGSADPGLRLGFPSSGRSAGDPSDLLPGDQVLHANGGSAVGALLGKVAMLRGGPLAAVQAFGETDLVQVFAGIYRLITWMGEAQYVNRDGKTSFIWRGAADQLTESGPDEAKYTVRLDVGATGDLIRLEVVTREEVPVFTFHVDSAGKMTLYSAGGINQHAGSTGGQNHPLRYQGSVSEEITGNNTKSVRGDMRTTCEGVRTTETSVTHVEVVGQDHLQQVTRNHKLSVGSNYTRQVYGESSIFVTNGAYRASVYASGLYSVKTQLGDITFESQGANFRVQASRPNSVWLGTEAAHHAVRFEPLERLVQSLVQDLNAFKLIFNQHTHIVSGTAGPFAITASTVPPVVAARSLTLNLTPARSEVVRVA